MIDLNYFLKLVSEYLDHSQEPTVFDIFNAARSIATAGTFIYLVIMDWQKK
jgi:hypothetical protein